MKNLKKILALVLAFACAFTMFAGAAFTDGADIKATDAVNMLSSLGVITGYTDGSYQPDKVVTRAEMAKMIFVVRNNKIDDSAYQKNYSKLTDIANHWAKGYIKFCESQGIIAGRGNNKFDPDAPVTGVEAAKMLLVVSGYDTEKAGLTGMNWRTNTLKYAGAAGILDDVNSALESGLPRQYAAQMIYNTLDVNRVKWSEDSKSFDDILNGGVKETVGSAYMGLSYDYGTLVQIDKDSLKIVLDDSYDADNYHNSDRNYKDGDKVTFTKVSEDYTSLLGQKVKVMFKDGKTNNVLGVYAIADNTVYDVLMNQVELDGSKVKFGGKSYSVDGSTIETTYIAYDGTQTTKPQSLSYFNKKATPNPDGSNGNLSTDEVTFIDADGNGKIDTAIVFQRLVGEVTYVSSDKVTIGNKTYKYADENIDENIAKDDWAVISANLYDDCADIVKADVLNADIDGQKDKSDVNPATYVQYKIDGTWYNIASDKATDVSNGDTVKAYVVNGVIVKIKSDDGKGGFPTNVAVVVSKGYINGDQVKIRYYDGTSKTVTVSDNTTFAGGQPVAGTAYKVSGSDDSMKFEALNAGTKYNGYKFHNASAGAADPTQSTAYGIKVDDSAAVILYDGDGRSKMLTGKQYNALKTTDITDESTAASAAFTKEKNGLNRVMMLAVKAKTTITGESSDNYAYVVSDNGKNKDGNAVFTIWTANNEYKDVIQENAASAMPKGTLIGYSTIDSNNVIKDVKTIAAIKDVDTGSLTNATTASTFSKTEKYYGANRSTDTKSITVQSTAGGSAYNRKLKITADTTVLMVDSAADDDDQIGVSYTYGSTAMAKAEEYLSGSDKKYSSNVLFMTSEDGADDIELEVLLIDTTGAFDGKDHNNTTPSTPATPGALTKDNVTVNPGAITGTSIAAVRVATGKAQISLALSAADASKTTVSGTVKATVDGASVAAAGTIVGGQLQINITDDYVKANSVITIDLTGVSLA